MNNWILFHAKVFRVEYRDLYNLIPRLIHVIIQLTFISLSNL